MVKVLYFLLLLLMSVEDARTRKINHYAVPVVYLLGLLQIVLRKENRWVTVALTCMCFGILFLLYILIRWVQQHTTAFLVFGGADVRLIPGMILVQGADAALAGVFFGLLAAFFWNLVCGRQKRTIPLIPWMTAGCFFVEIIYFFSGKSVL